MIVWNTTMEFIGNTRKTAGSQAIIHVPVFAGQRRRSRVVTIIIGTRARRKRRCSRTSRTASGFSSRGTTCVCNWVAVRVLAGGRRRGARHVEYSGDTRAHNIADLRCRSALPLYSAYPARFPADPHGVAIRRAVAWHGAGWRTIPPRWKKSARATITITPAAVTTLTPLLHSLLRILGRAFVVALVDSHSCVSEKPLSYIL